jgi:hypothetical protein
MFTDTSCQTASKAKLCSANSVIETIIDQVRYTRATGSHDDRRSTENG